MRNLALAGLLAMAAPLAMAQNGAQQPSGAAAAQSAAGRQDSGGEPTNLCQEFLAFMQAPAPGAAAASGAPAAARPATGPAASASQAAAPQGGASAAGGTERGESAQRLSGQAGVAVNAPEPNQAPGREGSVQAAPQQSSRSAPVPNNSAGTPKESVMSVQEAEALAKANDMQACRNAVQRMRRAGVDMPPPLLARAALAPEEAPAR